MKKTELKTPFGATATIYHQGGHVTSWVPSPALGEQIFVAEHSEYTANKAIRGGVPVCFPQFGGFGEGIKHGFARTSEWALHSVNSDQTQAQFILVANEETRALWPHEFELTLTVNLAPTQLTLTLGVKNTGQSPLSFGGALHTYFTVSHYTAVTTQNLNGIDYWDNGTPLSDKKTFNSEALQLEGAIDRVYFNAPNSLDLTDGNTIKRVTKTGFSDVVIWNPGAEGAKGLGDMGDNEYPNMLCIEAALVDKPQVLAPGESWQGTQAIEVVPVA